MNAGLDNALALRRRLLPVEMAGQDKYDDALAAIGLGVLGEFESMTGRKLTRLEDAEMSCTACRSFVVVDRYPIEGDPVCTVRRAGSNTWETVAFDNVFANAGTIYFPEIVGEEMDRLRIVWDGGYWVDTSDEGDGTRPTGATAVPANLYHAWITQCAHEVEQRRVIGGQAVVQVGEAAVRVHPGQIKILPTVAAVLDTFRRYF